MTTLTPTLPPKNDRLDLDSIRKYSVPGPRYTSYPPATKFTSELPALRLEEAIAEDSWCSDRPISLYFHLPFCESRCWFCGCNTVINQRREASAEYLVDLEREMRLTAERIDRNRHVVQIHLGGGTPTFFRPEELRKLGGLIREIFPNRAASCEFGVEIDPRRIDQDHVHALQEIGANRASLGVQDTNPRVQLAIHRFQPQAKNEQAFAWLREEGFSSINVDLIYGLPLQTEPSFAQTIDDVLALAPDRLSVFSYAHVPWIKPAQKVFDDRAQLPGADLKLAMFAVAHEKLTAAGLIDIGLDHFAKPDDELAKALRGRTLHRNFQGYSTQSGASLYGFGISSISSTPETYRQNFKTLAEWRAALEKEYLPVERGLRLTAEDQRRRRRFAHRLTAREAIIAQTAGLEQPRHTHHIALLESFYAIAHFNYPPDPLMTGREWGLGLDGPVAVRRVDICMANPAGLDLNEHLVVSGRGYRQFTDSQRLPKLGDEGGLHDARTVRNHPFPTKKGMTSIGD